jgi:hypothetical protein
MNQKPKHVPPNGALAMTVIAALLGQSLEDAAGGRTNMFGMAKAALGQ